MPNIPQQQTIVQYTANSAQTQYTFAFYAPLATDIQVYYQASTATPIPSADILALNTDYTVTFNADQTTGGYITLLFTPTTGFYLTINRQVAASLNTNFANAQNFNGANLDAALDRLLLLIQQNQNYALERNLSYIINTYLPNATPYTQLPPLSQNYIWIGSGNGVVAAPVTTVPSASVLQSMLANNSPGTDGALLVGYYDKVNTFPTTVDQALGYKISSGLDTGIANAIAIAVASNYAAYNGNVLIVKVANTNTGATTLAVNGGSALPVVKYSNTGAYTALVGKEMTTGGTYIFTYDTARWVLSNPNSITNEYFYGASVYLAGSQLVGAGSTLVQFDTVDYDNFSMFTLATSSLKPARPGYYTVLGVIQLSPALAAGAVALNLYKNGSLWASLGEIRPTGASIISGSFTLFLNGTTDYVQLYFVNSTGGNVTLVSSGFFNNFQITYNGS